MQYYPEAFKRQVRKLMLIVIGIACAIFTAIQKAIAREANIAITLQNVLFIKKLHI